MRPRKPDRLIRAFKATVRFCARHLPRVVGSEKVVQRLLRLKLAQCDEVKRGAADPRRALFHVGHRPSTICCDVSANGLSMNFIVGMMIHEVGHCIVPRRGESGADAAIFGGFGIVIEYRGPLALEWVSGAVVRKILG